MLPNWFTEKSVSDDLAWQAVADWLEEQGSPHRAELLRLTRRLLRDLHYANRGQDEARQKELLSEGVQPVVATLVNSIGMELVYIPAGRFLMGSPENEEGREEDEGPVHEVELTQGFWLGKYPVTQAQYRRVTGYNQFHFRAGGKGQEAVEGLDTSRFPAENVTWCAASKFCRELAQCKGEQPDKRTYRLPTEAEWEYSCRAGILTQPFSFGATLTKTQARFAGWYPNNDAPAYISPLERPCEVGQYPSNALGLYDMHGNIYEYCIDWFDPSYYQISPRTDPVGPTVGAYRVMRGGSWCNHGPSCRSASRACHFPSSRQDFIGFRVVLDYTTNPR